MRISTWLIGLGLLVVGCTIMREHFGTFDAWGFLTYMAIAVGGGLVMASLL